ncbi:hypothetical protein B7494_g639 [Chlorociboria aeruginascens]|nr:hypothetical protein B7494_g639 [Chlorociboria aeruginascens]
MTETILILGAGYVGLPLAHKLLKTVKNAKVTLVTSTTHFYWNMAAVRAIIPGQYTDDKIFQEIAPGFKSYSKSSFELIHGTATAVDPVTKSVSITTPTSKIEQSYDTLILATGSRPIVENSHWKLGPGGYEALRTKLHEIQDVVKKAKTIVVGGAGVTGVETAGELGFEYGKGKEILLITAGPTILPGLPAKVIAFAESKLKALSVKIISSTKITSTSTTAEGKTSLTLSDGSTKVVDLYLPSVGVVANTEFLPAGMRNEKGDVPVNAFLRVKGYENRGIWAVGDVSDCQPKQIPYGQKQVAHLVKNIDLVLKSKEPVPYKPDTTPMIAVTLGRAKGTAGWATSSCLARWYGGSNLWKGEREGDDEDGDGDGGGGVQGESGT